MFLFELLFGSRKSGAESARPSQAAATVAAAAAVAVAPEKAGPRAPGTRIRHDPELIVSLKDDHGRLFTHFQAIAAAGKLGDLAAVQGLLNQFRTMIQDHLLKENVRLYVYLEHLLMADPVSRQMMHGFRHEMDDIGRIVVGFLDKYKLIGGQPELAGPFAQDLAGIGEALVARIRREEEILYPMYSAPV